MRTQVIEQDLAPPGGWVPKSPFFKWLMAKVEAAQLAALRIPVSGEITCPSCEAKIPVSLHISGFEEPIPD